MTTDTAWQSFHIFLSDQVKLDRFLAEQLLPRLLDPAQTWVKRWFFIRYWEGGPHIRLRVQPAGQDGLDALLGFIASAKTAYLSDNPPTREAYYRAGLFERPIDDVAAMPWFVDGSVEPIAYEPETVRYGGADALILQEKLFEISAQLTARLTIATQGNWSQRAAVAMQLMIAAAMSATTSMAEMARFFQAYADYWESFAVRSVSLVDGITFGNLAETSAQLRAPAKPLLPKVWLDHLEGANEAMLALAQAGKLVSPLSGEPVREAAAVNDAIHSIVGSQVHMMNNRLGVAPDQEHFMATNLAKAARAALAEELAVPA